MSEMDIRAPLCLREKSEKARGGRGEPTGTAALAKIEGIITDSALTSCEINVGMTE